MKKINGLTEWTNRAVGIVAIFSLAVMLLAGWTGWSSAWGVNHLHFLSLPLRATLSLMIVLATVAVLTLPRLVWERLIDRSSILIAGCTGWRCVAVTAGAAALFLSFRLPNQFLGDGYTLLGDFSSPAGYVHKWTEPASSMAVRILQAAFGGYSSRTALLAFQALSIFSGAIAVVTVVALVRRLVSRPAIQFIGVVTLLFSGATLLYFGYVEFYPLLWAALLLYFFWAVRALQTGTTAALIIALVFYVIAVVVHLQALWLIGTVVWLVLAKALPGLPPRLSRLILVVAATLGTGIVLGGYFWLSQRGDSLSLICLPLLYGRSASPDYAAVSPKHLLDIVNLAALLFPGIAAVAVGRAMRTARIPLDRLSLFFGVGALGGVAFLVLVDPVLGMARDWDLLSFTLVPAVLWLLYSADRIGMTVSGRIAVLVGVLAASNGILYVSVYNFPQAAETRQVALLRYYGSKDYAGWKIFTDYLAESGRSAEAQVLAAETARVLPSYRQLAEGWGCFLRNDLQRASAIARTLVLEDPYRAEFLLLAGEVAAARGDTTLARRDLDRALRIKPNFPPVLRSLAQLSAREGDFLSAVRLLRQARRFDPKSEAILDDLGGIYIALGQIDSANAVADTLLAAGSGSAGGHLIKLIVAIKTGDTLTAGGHFDLYCRHGRGRPEYDRILQSYSFLLAQ